MKRFKLFAVLLVLLCGSSLYAKDFDWSECWCNYGGGISEGDWLVSASTGFYYSDFNYATHDDFWFIPPVMVEVQYAQPIWKLPFTFGGYTGMRAFGYKSTSCWVVFAGAEAAYHLMLPPKGLDVYGVSRFGASIPVVKPSGWAFVDYVDINSAIGANWFFGDFVAVNCEFGYPLSKIGVTFKF